MRIKYAVAAAASALLMGMGGAAHATSESFTLDYTLAGLGAGPYGTLTVAEGTGAQAGDLLFTIAMDSDNFRIHETKQSQHEAFYFSLINDPSIKITNLTSNFAVGPTNVAPSGFGAFDYSITYNGGSGYAGGAKSLSFTVAKTAVGGTLSLADLGSQIYTDSHQVKHTIYAATDVVNKAGGTGNAVYEADAASGTPEPAVWLMMITGFGMAGAALRRRRASVA
jgi:hypothetical protein